MGHNTEVRRYKFNEVHDARLDRWISMGHAEQVKRRVGTEKCVLMPKDDFMLFVMSKRDPKGSHKAARSAAVHTVVLPVSMRPTLA